MDDGTFNLLLNGSKKKSRNVPSVRYSIQTDLMYSLFDFRERNRTSYLRTNTLYSNKEQCVASDDLSFSCDKFQINNFVLSNVVLPKETDGHWWLLLGFLLDFNSCSQV